MVTFTVKSSLAAACLLSRSVLSSPVSPRQEQTYTNPILWQDLPDIDVFRVGEVYYYSSSTFAYSPGAPVLKSYDLANWTPVSHSVPDVADFGNRYNLNSPTDRAYVGGIWASSMRYRESNDKFYWMGCVQNAGKTFIYTAPGNGAAENNGEVDEWNWTLEGTINECYYDNGILVDDDDTMYVVWGNRQLRVTQLSADGLTPVRTQQVYDSGANLYLEGAHMYKTHGYYWVVPTKVASGEYVLRADNPWGPYEARVLFDGLRGPLDNAGYAHQGGMVDTPSGDWHYIAFLDAYPGGRIPVMAPMTWSNDNWPAIVLDSNGAWGKEYPIPVTTDKTVPGPTRSETFAGTTTLHQEWEWNHSPDDEHWQLDDRGLVLQAASVTDDLYTARNTLTHRILGPKSVGTFGFDISGMADGDRAGVAMFRDRSAYIGVHKANGSPQLVIVTGIDLNDSWGTANKGSVVATGPAVSGDKVWFQVEVDVTPAFGQDPNRQAIFRWSEDGESWQQLGSPFLLTNRWQFFSAYRFGAFNFATRALGGEVVLESFSIDLA